MSRSRFFFLIVLLLIVVLGDLIGSFGESGQLPVAEAADWMPTYRMAMSDDISTLNQWHFYGRNNDIFTGYILSNMTHSLYDLSHGGQWVPILADGFPSAPIQQDGIWDTTVTLKQGVSWSDGASFTADDVVFTYETCRALDLGGNWGAICHPEQLIDVEYVDDYTVLFTFNQFPGLGLWQGSFSQAPIMAQHYWDPVVQAAWEQEDPEFWLYDYSPVDEPVLGPFSFGMYSPGSYLELAANPNYFFQGLMVVEFANGAYQETLPGRLYLQRLWTARG